MTIWQIHRRAAQYKGKKRDLLISKDPYNGVAEEFVVTEEQGSRSVLRLKPVLTAQPFVETDIQAEPIPEDLQSQLLAEYDKANGAHL